MCYLFGLSVLACVKVKGLQIVHTFTVEEKEMRRPTLAKGRY